MECNLPLTEFRNLIKYLSKYGYFSHSYVGRDINSIDFEGKKVAEFINIRESNGSINVLLDILNDDLREEVDYFLEEIVENTSTENLFNKF